MAEVPTVHLPGPVLAVSAAGQGPDAPEQAVQTMLEAEREQLRQARAALAQAAQKLQQVHAQALDELRQGLPDLAVDVARKVLMQEIEAERYKIDPIVEAALPHVPARRDVVIHLNPDDLARCELAEEATGEAGAPNLRFVADPTVPRAECVLETDEGVVDSVIETNLETVADALKGPE